jgi:NADH-quinone oxidoreductase subunit M
MRAKPRAQHPRGHAVDDGLHLRVSLWIWAGSTAMPGFQFVEKTEWLGGHRLPYGRRRHFDAVRHPDHLPDADLHPGVVGMSVEKRVKEYMIAFLVLETLMIGVFCALDWCCSTSSSKPA